jgi:acyl-CoA thioesterase I
MVGLLMVALGTSGIVAEPVRVACLGDSITFGAGLAKPERESYPVILAEYLGSGYEVKNYGVSGRTLLSKGDQPYVSTPEFKQALAYKPNIVVICLGTNDTKPQNWKHADGFEDDYKALVKQFAALPGSPKVYACLPVPAYPGAFGIDDTRIKLGVVPKVKAVAKELELPVIDLYDELSGKKNLFPDTVHPNAQGAAKIAKAVHAALTKPK